MAVVTARIHGIVSRYDWNSRIAGITIDTAATTTTTTTINDNNAR